MRMLPVLVLVTLAVVAFLVLRNSSAEEKAPPPARVNVSEWQTVAAGMEVREFAVKTSSRTAPVVVVRAEPAKCVIRVVDAHREGDGARAPEVCPAHGAAINASFFAENGTPLGLVVVDGQQRYPFHPTGAWGLFLVRNGKPEIIKATGQPPAGTQQAVQSKPRLVVDGDVQSFKSQPPSYRSAAGVDGQGRLILAASDGVLTLEDWARFMKEQAGCVNALNLDGGPSTQLAVRGNVTRDVPGGYPAPTLIVVEAGG